MRKAFLIFIITLTVSNCLLAQKDTTYFKGDNFVGGSHNQLIVFCGYELEKVQPKFSAYLLNVLDLTSATYNNKSLPLENLMAVAAYSPKVGYNKPTKINVGFYCKEAKDGAIVVTKCIITGSWNLAANLFIQYWETSMSLEEVKSKTSIVKYTITDKITFTTMQDGSAKILITKN